MTHSSSIRSAMVYMLGSGGRLVLWKAGTFYEEKLEDPLWRPFCR
jgi:hypothetical protein